MGFVFMPSLKKIAFHLSEQYALSENIHFTGNEVKQRTIEKWMSYCHYYNILIIVAMTIVLIISYDKFLLLLLVQLDFLQVLIIMQQHIS